MLFICNRFCKCNAPSYKKKKKGIYNIGNHKSYKNIEIAKLICGMMNKDAKKFIKMTKDRPFNDTRYSINYNKIKKLNWSPKYSLKKF